MTVLGVALTTPAAMADDADTTTSAPETGTALEKISAYVQPSVVYLHMHWKGYVWDKARKEYVNSGLPFEVDSQCTGYAWPAVRPAGKPGDGRGYMYQWAIDGSTAAYDRERLPGGASCEMVDRHVWITNLPLPAHGGQGCRRSRSPRSPA